MKYDDINLSDPLFSILDCYNLPIENLDSAISFYKSLGHSIIRRDGNHSAGLHLPESDFEIALRTGDRPAETYFLVKPVPRAIERITTAGGTLIIGSVNIKVGLYAMLQDPSNNHLVILGFSKGTFDTSSNGEVVGNHNPNGDYLQKKRLRLRAAFHFIQYNLISARA